MNEVLVADCETDGFLATLTKLHMIQLGTLNGEDVTIYADGVPQHVIDTAREGVMVGDAKLYLSCPIRPMKEGIERLNDAELSYWHNGTCYDFKVMQRFHPGVLTRPKMRDTLVMARLLLNEFNNSLEAWGRRLGCHKGDFQGPYDVVTPEFLAYSQQDIPAGRSLARHLIKLAEGYRSKAYPLGAEPAVATEHAVAYWISLQEENGFCLDEEGCAQDHIDLQGQQRDMERRLRTVFPARWVKVGDVVPKAGNSRYGYMKGVPFTRVEYDEFSPGSRQMIAQRLKEKGWKPKVFTDGGQAKVDEDVLRAIAPRFPEAAVLADYFDITKQAAFVGSWLEGCRNGRVHGRVNPLRAYTQRMGHSDPNMAQIPKKGPYRKRWKPRKGWKLVGVDGEGIQARGLAHYLYSWDKGRYGKIIHEGRKEDETDIHSMNSKAIGRMFPGEMGKGHRRDTAKNINYAIYFGAQDPRLGQTLKDGIMGYAGLRPPSIPNRELGRAIRTALETNMRGLSKLNELVEGTFEKRGFLRGLDGRPMTPNSKRNALVTIIQGAEAVIMKTALCIFMDEVLPARGWEHGVHFAQVANVHDEVQMECQPEIAEALGKAFADCITEAGVKLDLKCPLAGDFKVGDNWHDTH